jgi:hypothetical protein
MSREYQRSDAHIIDYELYELPGVDDVFRGPPVTSGDYIACVGAAQTFGRFVRAPFPALISCSLGIAALNLGRGGAGPAFHLSNAGIMEYINRARMVIVQVLSGRSQSNSIFSIPGHRVRGTNLVDGRELSADQFYTWLMGEDPVLARKIVAETRENYVLAMTRLLNAIKPPKVLLWFSVRSPDYQERWELPIERLWGDYPQLVNRPKLDRLQSHADLYVESVSREGLPQPLLDRNGAPASFQSLSLLTSEIVTKTENRYYPSPEMHRKAAALLTPACHELLNGRSNIELLPARAAV